MDFQEIESRVSTAVHDVVADLAAHEPGIEQAASDMLTAVGAPPEVASAVSALLGALRAHFTTTAQAAAAALDAQPDTPADQPQQ